jgi:hypothetical protein
MHIVTTVNVVMNNVLPLNGVQVNVNLVNVMAPFFRRIMVGYN